MRNATNYHKFILAVWKWSVYFVLEHFTRPCQGICMEVTCVLGMRVKPQGSFSCSSIAKSPQNQTVLKVKSSIFKST